MPAIAENLTILNNVLFKLIDCKFAFDFSMSSVGDDLERHSGFVIMITVSMERTYKADCPPVLFSEYGQLLFHSSMCISIYSDFLLQDHFPLAISFRYAAPLICWRFLASAYLQYRYVNQETPSFYFLCRDFLNNQFRRGSTSAHRDLSKDIDAPPPTCPHPIHMVSATSDSKMPANLIAPSRPHSLVESSP